MIRPPPLEARRVSKGAYWPAVPFSKAVKDINTFASRNSERRKAIKLHKALNMIFPEKGINSRQFRKVIKMILAVVTLAPTWEARRVSKEAYRPAVQHSKAVNNFNVNAFVGRHIKFAR